ncbi:MAG TPA: prepilin peptidase [Enterococcus columbae]|nr:prepilin peptidase [Enterococcus columbae]
MFIIIFMLGACFGSFFYLIITRRQLGQSILFPASHCPYCQHRLTIWELIPILSICCLRFRCHTCHQKIPVSSLITEILSGIMFSYVFYSYPASLSQKCLALVWLSLALILSVADCLYLSIDLQLFFYTHLLLWFVLFSLQQPFFLSHLLVCSAALLISLLLKQTYLGNGDLLLACAWFPWLSYQQINLLLLIASGLGLIGYGLCFLNNRRLDLRLPFIPFLSLGLFWVYFLS